MLFKKLFAVILLIVSAVLLADHVGLYGSLGIILFVVGYDLSVN